MKALKLLCSTVLALAAVAGLTLVLTPQQPPPVSAEKDVVPKVAAPRAPAALPTPYLSDDDVVDAPYDNPPAPTVDGVIDPGEYAGAGKVTFPGYGGHYHDVEVFFKHDAITLYVAFELPDKIHKNPWPDVSLYLDTNHDGGSAPQADDFRFLVWRNNAQAEWQGTGTGWVSHPTITWTYGMAETMSGWSVEFGIPFSKLGINAGTFTTLGLALANGGFTPTYDWPSGVDTTIPDTWGTLVSSSDWDTFYWKPGPWEDYAPSGMPDFDQKQNEWFTPSETGDIWTHDGPASVANSLWWFDSKFEPEPYPPEIITDHYRLVTTYGDWDDHYYSNTVPLIDDLARHFNTNGLQNGANIAGTTPYSMFYGIHDYLRAHGLWDDYIVTMVVSPTFEWVTDEVMRSEDVILLLGIYEDQDPGPDENWVRVGGHYVNVAGVDPINRQIAFSDPLMDATEQGMRSGRVLSGALLSHIPIPGHPVTVHNDAGNVSHDIYTATTTNSPGGTWGPEKYGLWDPGGGGWIPIEAFFWIFGANPHPYINTEPWDGTENLQTEVEFAIAVSPYTWKASGEWLPEGTDPVRGIWQPWQDYAPNGVPDFDQKQDCWGTPCPPGPPTKYTFCGPVAAANSLWWFDSKFEPIPGSPPAYNDNYPLVETYDVTDPIWDDHDPLNVDDPSTSWPPGGGWPPPAAPMPPGQGEFIEDLALYFQTDQAGNGTQISNMYTGIEQYIIDKGLRQGYVITMAKSPDFWWVAEEVEVSEDVILLLGFWEDQQDPDPPDEPLWVRVGGHYVTVPGVDKQGGLVAFSDPWYDGAEYNWPRAYPAGWPTAMGRVADGWLTIPHPPYHTHGSTIHNDAGNISHDVYYVAATDSPGGVWGPWEYVEGGILEENFLEQNGDFAPWDGGIVQAEVDYALAVSPVADLWIEKQVTPTTVYPGGWVTFTLTYGNWGNLAQNVVISDRLPSTLINARVVSSQTTYGGPIVSHDTFTWTVGHIPWDGRGNGHGTITFTAQVNPELELASDMVVTNTAEITSTTQEQYQLEERPNSHWVTFTIAPPPTWNKWVNSTLWHTGFSVTVETSDTLEVVDVISTPQHFTLHETWNSDHLDLLSATLDPASGGTVATSTNSLKLTGGGWVTLTKLFHIEECTWTQTLLTETLWVNGQAWQKPVTINKQIPNLHIAATYEPEVFPGQELTFTLHYSNTGGYENDVMVGSVLPTVTTFITSSGGAPDDGGLFPDGRIWWGWNAGDLANGDYGTLMITALVTHTLAPSNTFVISGTIIDHNGDIQDTDVFTPHISPPQAQWDKRVYVNGVLTSTRPVPVVPSDTVQVIDRVWFTYTKPVTFTLVETWTHSLELTGTPASSVGNVVAGTAGVQWSATSVATNTWHVLTKTFHITGTEWLFDYLTETLSVEGDTDVQQKVVRFRHKGFCWPVKILDLTSNSPVGLGHATTFSTTLEGDAPITYTWDFGGAGTGSDTSGPTPTYTYTAAGTYTVTLDVENDCGTDTQSLKVTVNPPPEPTWDKQIWISGQGGPFTPANTPFTNILTGDIITITDRVWVTHTGAITFTLEETWSDSLTLTHVLSNGGHVTQGPGAAVTWSLENGTANTWYVLTKTFEVVSGTWTVDIITETLDVEDAVPQPSDVVLKFYHAGVCIPVDIVNLTSNSPVQVREVAYFTATVTGHTPITYAWDFDSDGTPEQTGVGLDVISHTYTAADSYTVTLEAENNCPSNDTQTAHVTVNLPQYTLTVNEVGSGTVTLNPPGATYTEGAQVELIANAESGWIFDHWDGDLTGSDNPDTLTMDGHKEVTATFTASSLPTYTLKVYTVGNGEVQAAPSQTTYVSGTVVRLTATPDPGWYFVTWRGDVSQANNPVNVTMSSDKTIFAVFSETPPPTYTLTTNTVGDGSITRYPSQTTYISGTWVLLTAVPNSGWIFNHWEGNVTDAAQNPTVAVMDQDKIVTATFNTSTAPTYTLRIQTIGQGSVTKSPSLTTYISGTTVRLTATPDPNWYFVTWQGDATIANNPVDLVIDEDKLVVAVFSPTPPPTYTLTINTDGQGDVSRFPSQTTYISGTVVRLTATPHTGWHFITWSGSVDMANNPLDLLMDGNKEITATFSTTPAPTYTLTLNTEGSGSVTKSPNQATYQANTQVSLKANPTSGWTFDHWSGALTGNTNPTTLKMTSDKEVTATFVTTSTVCTPVDTASIAFTPPNPETGTPIVFNGTVAQGDTPITWAWAFGDNTFDTGQTVTHTYTLSDTYTVILTATNCTGTGVATTTTDIPVPQAPAKIYLPLVLRSSSGS